jgi:hypothetical protein
MLTMPADTDIDAARQLIALLQHADLSVVRQGVELHRALSSSYSAQDATITIRPHTASSRTITLHADDTGLSLRIDDA